MGGKDAVDATAKRAAIHPCGLKLVRVRQYARELSGDSLLTSRNTVEVACSAARGSRGAEAVVAIAGNDAERRAALPH